MRGGAQSHLIEAADGYFYVVKAPNNPQHRRVLVNEWLATAFLKYLQIPAAEAALVHVPPELVESSPGFSFQLGSRLVPVSPGWHYGSRCPADPGATALYDYVAWTVAAGVHNLRDFLGAYAFDKWMGNSDVRQALFFRAALGSSSDEPRRGWVAWMIDHGYVFDGPAWGFRDSPLAGMFVHKRIYEIARRWEDFEPWLERIEGFPEQVIDEAWRSLPPEWIDADEADLERVLDRLLDRRSRVRALIEDAWRAPGSPFANLR